MNLIISGCHSGPNPSAGLGIALSIRLAYPAATLVAKDYSVTSTGIHHPVFDDCWMSPSWDDLDLAHHRALIESRLRTGSWYISTLDLEICWLAESPHSHLLCPGATALGGVSKPSFPATAVLPVSVPDSISWGMPDIEVEQFCRRYGWPVWVKGPQYEAVLARNWQEVQDAGDTLGERWGTEGLFVQAHMHGEETSILFSAWRGRLLDGVVMDKRMITEQGKTWGGVVQDMPEDLRDAVARFASDLNWTGGCELECVRDCHGVRWLIDCNPRFPAWVYGATLAGHNLPALLLASATGSVPVPAVAASPKFARVVCEIPVRESHPLHPLRQSQLPGPNAGKHPSGMPRLRRRLAHKPACAPMRTDNTFSALETATLEAEAQTCQGTPCRVLLLKAASQRFKELAARCAPRADGCAFKVAYSVKTNPDARFLRMALENGFMAEVISPEEIHWALRNEFQFDDLVYNGPRRLRSEPGRQIGKLRAVFADSLSMLDNYVQDLPSSIVGARLRPPGIDSRFGIQVEDPGQFRSLVDIMRHVPESTGIGFSFHMQSSAIGLARWTAASESLLSFCVEIEGLLGRQVSMLDFGGGWAPNDTSRVLEELLPGALRQHGKRVCDIDVVIEPGKSLVDPCVAVLTRVLEVRPANGSVDYIVDAGLCDIPMARFMPHRVALLRDGRLLSARKGSGKLLGRLCMETDCLVRSISFPEVVCPGDLLAVCDVGAYDTSMSYSFGLGRDDHERW